MVSVVGRTLTYEFAHEVLGLLGHIVIRPVTGPHWQLECQCATSGAAETLAERKATLISLGEYVRKLFEERYFQATLGERPSPEHPLH